MNIINTASTTHISITQQAKPTTSRVLRNITKVAMLLGVASMIILTGCMSTENPRNFDETGKLTEATVYDVSQTPRVPLADAWVVVEYWYVAGNGLVEAKDICRVSYSVKSDAMGKVRFPERTKHTVKIDASKLGYVYKTARIKPPYEVSLQPLVRSRAEEFIEFVGSGRYPYCERTGDLQTNLKRIRYFYELAESKVDQHDAREQRELWWMKKNLDKAEASIAKQ
jgi:hypothetical protein